MKEEMKAWEGVYIVKNSLVESIVEEIGERNLDVSECNVCVFAIEHHCNEGFWGTLNMMNKDRFTMGDEFDGIQLVWKDMIVEDLAMVLDYLRTGNW